MKKISIIIPFLNEGGNINHLVAGLNSFLESKKSYDTEVIFVDDGSSDDSVALLRTATHHNYEGKVISLSKNYGSHAALRAGICHASGDYVCFMYADLQDPLSLVDEMSKVVEQKPGTEIVWASRRRTSSGFAEKTFSKLYSSLMKKYVSTSYPESGFDVVLFSKKVAGIINKNIEANSSIFLQILTLGFRQSFIAYDKQQRKIGKSKWTLSKKIKLFIDSFIAFSYAPIRFVTIIGLLFFITGLSWSTYIIIRKLTSDDLVSGWPALVSILLMGFGITNISLGIIAEYLWRTLDSARKRPVFIISEIIDLGRT